MDTTYSRLRELRKENNLSQMEMAKIMDCHVNSIYLYESGQVEMPVSKAKKLAKYLKIDWWMLYED